MIAILLLAGEAVLSSQDRDTVANLTLEKSVITAQLKRPLIEPKAGISGTVAVEELRSVPSFLGNADPISFVRMLPGVQVNTEIDGGLYVQGSDYSHTLLSIDGVPVYGGSHLLGLFSVFNASHYSSMAYSTGAGQEPRLGGSIDMKSSDVRPGRLEGEVSAGLLSSQGTLRFPTGKNSARVASARRSYSNLLYGKYIKYDGQPIKYGFTDANLTWLWMPSSKDRVKVNLFADRDKAAYDYASANISLDAAWYNMMGSVRWDRDLDRGKLEQTAFASINGLNAFLDVVYAQGWLPSYIHSFGYRGTLSLDPGWEVAEKLTWYRVQPQNPKAEGHYNTSNISAIGLQQGLESVTSVSWSAQLGYYFNIKAGVGANVFASSEDRTFFGLTPELELGLNLIDAGKFDFRVGIHRQNLFLTGFTNVGLPCEFWLTAGRNSPPQWSLNSSLSYNVSLAQGKFRLSAEVYGKLLRNQLEYKGTIMEILNSNYSVESSLLKGRGYSYGVNLMAQKSAGRLTGWVGYAFGRSRRSFDDPLYPGVYPSDHERLHEVNVVASYELGRFEFGGSFVCASGTPYTRPDSFYILGDRVICCYGERNAARLPAYARMDLSINWFFYRTDRRRAGLNFSMYNVLGRRNAVGFGVHSNQEDLSYEFLPTVFEIRFLPSLAVFYKF